jgi:Asp-tRNA(Asn)/Glu-tRNA(Gln) amidotransferase C subunit
MNDKEKIAHRLASLEDVKFSPADLEAIVSELEDLERVVAELEEFAQVTPWISLQVQPVEKKD